MPAWPHPRGRDADDSYLAGIRSSCTAAMGPLQVLPVPITLLETCRSRWGARQLTSACTRTRPLPVILSVRKSPRQRPVSKHSGHRPTPARRDPFSKAVAHSLAALVDLRCRPYVRSSISRTGTADPLLTSVRHVFAHQQSPLARSSDMFGRPQKV